MIKYFNRFSPKYLTSLVYMLQTSEYKIGEYAAWLRRAKDFSTVQTRKQLVMTNKVKAILGLLWGMVLLGGLLAMTGIALWFITGNVWWGVLAIMDLILAPWWLAYGVIVPLWLGEVLVQGPQERQLIVAAHQKLAAHSAVKIAIAGSYGKTTFKETLAAILAQGKKVAATPGNKNTPLGISQFVNTLKGDEEVLIFELGEYVSGDIQKLCELVQPDMGVITGVNEAHLEKFKTLERTTSAIFELADFLGDKPLYKNAENALVKNKIDLHDSLAYTRAGVNGWQVTGAHTSLDGTIFVAQKNNLTIQAHSALLGLHQIGPIVACIDLAQRLGLTAEQIEIGIAQTKPFEHRLQPQLVDGVVTIDDTYNGNPDGVTVALDFLKQLNGHRLVYVTPGLVEAGGRVREVHVRIGQQLVEAKIDVVVLVKNSVTPFIEEGLKSNGFNGKLIIYPDALTCLRSLSGLTVSGDVVLMQNDWPDSYA